MRPPIDLPARNKLSTVSRQHLRRRPMTLDETLPAVRALRSPFGVWVVEGEDPETGGGKPARSETITRWSWLVPAPWARSTPWGPSPSRRPLTSPPAQGIETFEITRPMYRASTVVDVELFVHETADAAVQAASKRIADLISASEERFSFGLAGGSAAEATYRMLRGRASGWDKVDAWLSDERWVPPDHERSNGRMAAATLLDHVGANFVRPQVERVRRARGRRSALRGESSLDSPRAAA